MFHLQKFCSLWIATAEKIYVYIIIIILIIEVFSRISIIMIRIM